MKFPRRQFLHLAAGAAALPALPHVARAQAYPTRPVRIVVGFAAGGTQDILARLMGQWLSERLGQPFVVENRPGAASNIATETVVNASPDGYTLLLVGPANATNATLSDKLNYNFIRDISPVAGISREASVMAVHPSFLAKAGPEFIAYARSNPGKINMGSAGSGGSSHVFGELFKMMAGINMVHVPYRGIALALTDLIGGQVQVLFSPTAAVIEHIRTSRVRALGVTTKTRSEVLPDIPTVDSFVPGYEASGLYGVGAPKNTSPEVLDKLNREINAGLADSKMKARFAELGSTPIVGSRADFGKLIADETEKWGKVIRAANIKAD
jgi:tripartite-type tricarboxylate transporter receptor subunit TctC